MPHRPAQASTRISFVIFSLPFRSSSIVPSPMFFAKYVAKNIGDGTIELDRNGNEKITKEMRVDAWAGLWGIRQFQPLGQPPVTGYRELRRVPEAELENAPEHIKRAWRAGNRVALVDEETGEVAG